MFADQAQEHPAGDGPLADYELAGRDSAVPGLVGVVLVLVLVSGTTYVLRRRTPGERQSSDTADA